MLNGTDLFAYADYNYTRLQRTNCTFYIENEQKENNKNDNKYGNGNGCCSEYFITT